MPVPCHIHMPKRNNRILAIDPGTRHMGVALLDGGRLVYHGVKNISGGGSPHDRLIEARRLVLRLIRDFRPNVLAIEKAFFANNRNVALLNVFVDDIRAIARRKKLTVVGFAPSTVKKWICGNGRANKRQVARVVVAKYPQLGVYMTQDRKWKERYHQNMFDAVAIGMMARAKVQSRPSR